MVSTLTRETVLFVAVGIAGYVAALQVGAPDVLAGAFLLLFGAVAPALHGRTQHESA